MTDVPDWYHLILLGLAAWRVFYLLGHDTILDRPRQLVVGLGWSWDEGDPIPKGYREKLGDMIECPYCLGFWVTLAAWAAWLVFPTETIWLSVPLALNAIVVGAHTVLSAD